MDILQSLFNKEKKLEVNVTDIEYYIDIDGKLEFLGKCTSDIPEEDREFNFKVSINEDATRYEYFDSIRVTGTNWWDCFQIKEQIKQQKTWMQKRTSPKGYKRCRVIEQSNGVSTKKYAEFVIERVINGYGGDKDFEVYLNVTVDEIC